MNLQARDQRQLTLSGIAAVVLISIGGLLVWWGQKDFHTAQNDAKSAEKRAGDIRNKLRQVNVEEQEIRTKSDFFRQLEQRKIVGVEQRLDWIELIDRIREEHRLFEIDYEITQQRQEGAPLGEFRINASEMKFSLPLLHEEDLLRFLGDLQKKAPAIVQARQCTLSRVTGDRPAGDPNLNARCSLQWMTIGKIKPEGASQ